MSSRLSSNKSSIRLEIQINDQVKFGKIAYKQDDPICKVFHDLKRIKILPERIDDEEVKYFDRNNQELPKMQLFAHSFDVNDANNLIKLIVPQQSIDIEDTTRRADQYIRNNKKKREEIRERSEAENLAKNLKPIFSAIREGNEQQLSTFCDNPEFLSILEDYANERKQLWNLSKVYQRIIEGVLQTKHIEVSELPGIHDIDAQSKQSVNSLVRKLNNLKKEERIATQFWQLKEESLKKVINDLKMSLDECKNKKTDLELHIQELKRQISEKQAKFDEYQRDVDDKKEQYEQTISALQLQNTTLENKYDSCLIILQQNQEQKNKQSSLNLQKNEASINQNKLNHLNDIIKYFTPKDSILLELALDPKHCQQILQKTVPSISHFKLLFKYDKLVSSDRFHKLINFKNNIFLIAKTTNGRIFGGFSSLPFDPAQRKHSPQNILSNLESFLFTIYKNELQFFPIKRGFDSVEHDEVYIVFGNEQICIDRFKAKVESELVRHSQEYLHYSDPNNVRSFFLGDKEERSADLTGFQIYQIETL